MICMAGSRLVCENGLTSGGAHVQGKPSVYREIEIESCKTLSDLAEVVVHAFNFKLGHRFGFYPKLTGPDVLRAQPSFELSADESEESDARNVRRTCLADAFPVVGHTMLLMLDYADNWRFVVEVIRRGQKAAKTCYPKVLKTMGQAPGRAPSSLALGTMRMSWDGDDEADDL